MKKNTAVLLFALLALAALVVYSQYGFKIEMPPIVPTTVPPTTTSPATTVQATTTVVTTTVVASCNDLCVSKNYTSGSCVPSCLAGYLHATEWTKCEYEWEKCCCKPKV